MICVYVCVYVYIYIYIHIERARERCIVDYLFSLDCLSSLEQMANRLLYINSLDCCLRFSIVNVYVYVYECVVFSGPDAVIAAYHISR